MIKENIQQKTRNTQPIRTEHESKLCNDLLFSTCGRTILNVLQTIADNHQRIINWILYSLLRLLHLPLLRVPLFYSILLFYLFYFVLFYCKKCIVTHLKDIYWATKVYQVYSPQLAKEMLANSIHSRSR